MAFLTHSCRNILKQYFCKPGKLRQCFRDSEVAAQATDAARNIETDSSSRNNTALFSVECRDSANWKSIAPMGIRHGHRRAHQAGECGYIRNLLQNLIIHAAKQRRTAVKEYLPAFLVGSPRERPEVGLELP